jgi:hypothetical protein
MRTTTWGAVGRNALIAHLPFLERLRDQGRARAQRWLAEHARGRAACTSTSLACTRRRAPA